MPREPWLKGWCRSLVVLRQVVSFSSIGLCRLIWMVASRSLMLGCCQASMCGNRTPISVGFRLSRCWTRMRRMTMRKVAEQQLTHKGKNACSWLWSWIYRRALRPFVERYTQFRQLWRL